MERICFKYLLYECMSKWYREVYRYLFISHLNINLVMRRRVRFTVAGAFLDQVSQQIGVDGQVFFPICSEVVSLETTCSHQQLAPPTPSADRRSAVCQQAFGSWHHCGFLCRLQMVSAAHPPVGSGALITALFSDYFRWDWGCTDATKPFRTHLNDDDN